MAKINWSKSQIQAIKEKGRNVLVSAAAGSGKTAVLVERIIQKIIKDNVDIDRLLIVTFTNAAASEIKYRILEAIYNKLDETPQNEQLQRQVILLNRASICTIHSFCLDIIRNNFYEIGISSDFKIGDTSELELLKIEAMDDLFEYLYETQDSDFLQLVNKYATYRTDENLRNLIKNIYEYIQSNPFPREWLNEQVEKFNLKEKLDNDFSNTIWGQVLLGEVQETIDGNIEELTQVLEQLNKDSNLLKFCDCIEGDIFKLKEAKNALNSWDSAYELINNVNFQKWPIDKKYTSSLKDEAKKRRDLVKVSFNKLKERFINCTSREANSDIYSLYETFVKLKDLVFKFGEKYTEKKQDKNIIDFNDIEHYALKILVKNVEDSYVPTDVAKSYMNKFEEIAIDEYQDSNLVQETILSAVSNGRNMFMVGDVKQSIYKFRQARPELFIKKYEEYALLDNSNPDQNVKIQLFNNYRSRKNIIDFVNLVFENIMSKKLGDIDYTKEEYLNYTANYPEMNVENEALVVPLKSTPTHNVERRQGAAQRITSTMQLNPAHQKKLA